MSKKTYPRELLLLFVTAACSGDLDAPSGGMDPATMDTSSNLPDDTAGGPAGGSATGLPPAADPGAAPGAATPGTSGDPEVPAGGGDDPGPTPGGGMATGCEVGVPGTSQIPRLTNAQYSRTIQDLLGVSAPGLLATEQVGDITTSIWAGYQASADAIAATVMADPSARENFMKCTPSGDGAECLRDTIVEFGRRAFRRPLTEAEIADFQTLIDLGPSITPTGAPEEVAEVILATFLQSPSFLQRAELSEAAGPSAGSFALNGHEVAQRLSYMLWGTTPDEELDTAADAGRLTTKEQVLEQARRMITDDKAREVAAEFHRVYLHLSVQSRWDSVQKDGTLFPAFTPQVVPDMINETEMLFDEVFKSGGAFRDLLTTNVGYVTGATAPLYGAEGSFGETPTRVEFPEGERPGFLTRVGFLSAYSSQARTNPIIRGAFITKDVLGLPVGMPDPNATMTELPMGADLDTNRKRYAEMTKNEPCSTCHTPLVNPPGFVLEHYDTTGKVQTTERDTMAPIDTVADVLITPSGPAETVSGPAELMAKIAESPAAQRFYAQRWVTHAFGRELTGPDHCTVDRLGAAQVAPDYSIQDLVVDLTQSDYFMTRAIEVTQ